MNKNELLEEIKENLDYPRIKFPRDIDLNESHRTITLSMNDGVENNMQKDSAAFEGWILCIKAAMDKITLPYRFVLDWKEPSDINNLHYQRFLYRVHKFNEICGKNGGWFTVKYEHKLSALRIRYDSGVKYCLNKPSTGDGERVNDSKENPENAYENYIIKNQDRLSSLKNICKARLMRQLPVGVFENCVRTDTTILPRAKSAIDIWGVDESVLYIFELKAEKNMKVGALSELFFYAMIIYDEQHLKDRLFRDSKEGEAVRSTKSIQAYLLAPFYHPIITKEAFNIINGAFREKNIEITFGHIRFSTKNGQIMDDFSICSS